MTRILGGDLYYSMMISVPSVVTMVVSYELKSESYDIGIVYKGFWQAR